MNYTLITDSCADLTAQEYKNLDVKMLSLTVRVGNTEIINDGGVSYDIRDFYARLRAGETGTTSQVPPERFAELFRAELSQGRDIVYAGFSTGLSATFESSLVAREMVKGEFPDRRIELIDTKCASGGQGIVVTEAAKLRLAGKSFEEVVKFITEMSPRMQHWVTVNDLAHLRRGGRISAASAFFGTLINIKPIIHMNHAGRLIAVDKVRGRRKSIQTLIDSITKYQVDVQNQAVWILHSDAAEEATELEGLIKEKFSPASTHVGFIGPVIGAHTGPDTLVVFFCGQERTQDYAKK